MADPIDFGGRTTAAPCLALGGLCSWEDYDVVRQRLQLEHNALVRALNAYNAQVGITTSWSNPLAAAAWSVYEESYALTEKYPTSAIGWALQGSIVTMSAGAVGTMIEMAIRDQAAAVDIDALLAAAGVAVPSKPAPPPPEKTVGREFLDFSKDIAKGLGVLVAVGVVAVLAYGWATKRSAASG